MGESRDTQLLKGLLPLLLIRTISSAEGGESYGYEIVTRLRSAGMDDLSEGTVYPALSRMEREKHLRSRLIASSQGPARKYYAVTPEGDAFASEVATAWRHLTDVLDALRRSTREGA